MTMVAKKGRFVADEYFTRQARAVPVAFRPAILVSEKKVNHASRYREYPIPPTWYALVRRHAFLRSMVEWRDC